MVYTHNIDKVALDLGAVQIHWYGLMYLVGFALAWWLANSRAAKSQGLWNKDQVSDLIFYGALGVVIGGRVGSMLFYYFDDFIARPWMLLKVWEGGMSFHGGLLGVLVAMLFYGRKINKSFFQMTDFIAPLVPLGLGAGRIGNFINGELYGKPTDGSWGVIFPSVGIEPRHPSQLYEFALEGVVLFLILYWFSQKPRPRMAVSGVFLLGYGLFRSLVEFVRLPDEHLQYIAFDWLTMGQILSLPMIILGVAFIIFAYQRYPLINGINSDDQAFLDKHKAKA
ncbi:prolipoprotein diacylglyceryl transferase [Spartinivicinus poritis]|uniref:Phosphatidylglycerol--prolipoprotein diacylglyceryl transferase n=1 Tax=Spartinivicinus poritis TaxID=2994640 RepID=A0ABT5U4U4_9GAMM|nr:prolipoprotein diacylglyceryl transferase [Spartinivicinus sp. A2-2]MDE1461380.1 prolipoprotein diacylglyceryl transferase [Spartinivicinus sp. A2-2]